MATTVAVAGALANKPGNGGEAWVRLSWVRGLLRLGFDVVFIEQIDPGACHDETGKRVPLNKSINLAFFKAVVSEFGLRARAVLVDPTGEGVIGMGRGELLDRLEGATLVNISGNLTAEPIRAQFRTAVFVDLDPGYTQVWHQEGVRAAHLHGHDLFFTVGLLIGTDLCTIPDSGVPWLPLRPPVVLDDWPLVEPPEDDPIRFTTVSSFRGAYGPIEHDGRTFALKAHQLRAVADLPRRVHHHLEIALAIHAADHQDRDSLLSNGWHLTDPLQAAADPHRFRRYVQRSGAELSVTQGIYSETNSGWMSDRTTRYLATGRPALVQDTGIGRTMPVGDGLLVFHDVDGAVEGLDRIAKDYDHHCAAARQLAEELFDSDVVLSAFVDRLGIAP